MQPQGNWGRFMAAFAAVQEPGLLLGQVSTHLRLSTLDVPRVGSAKNVFLSNKTFSLNQILGDSIDTTNGKGNPTQIGVGEPEPWLPGPFSYQPPEFSEAVSMVWKPLSSDQVIEVMRRSPHTLIRSTNIPAPGEG